MFRDGEVSTKMWWLFSFPIRCSRLTMTNKLLKAALHLWKHRSGETVVRKSHWMSFGKKVLKAIKNNLKLNQIPWKINEKEIIINNTASLQPTTLLKMNSLMNLFWRFQYFSSISLADFDTRRIQFLKSFIT